MKKIRILQIMGKVVGGGVESVILNYYMHIDHAKFDFDFVVDGEPLPYLKKIVKQYGGNIYCITPYEKNIIRYTQEIYRIVKKGNYDIVHSNMNAMSGFSLFAAKMAGAKIRILHNHTTANKGEGLRTVAKYLLRPFAKLFATHYCACSEMAAKWMYGDNWKQCCHIIYNAIDLSKFTYNLEIRKQMRDRLCLKPDQLVVGHVGRFMYQKNHEFLVKCFYQLLKERKDAILLLIGDGPLRREIEQEVCQLGIRKNVYFLGVQNNVNEWMQAMDVFVFPSWYEGLGMVAIEAQASGLPVLSSEHIPAEAKCTDLLVREKLNKGEKYWAKKIEKILISNRSVLERSMFANYDIKRQSKKLEKYYLGITKVL